MMAYQLLARCKYLTLAGSNEYGDLEWIGTSLNWMQVTNYERDYE